MHCKRNVTDFVIMLCIETLELHKPPNDTVINPTYQTIMDDHHRRPVGELTRRYEEVDILPEVKVTQDSAYAVVP